MIYLTQHLHYLGWNKKYKKPDEQHTDNALKNSTLYLFSTAWVRM
jgi:hypothetical protein